VDGITQDRGGKKVQAAFTTFAAQRQDLPTGETAPPGPTETSTKTPLYKSMSFKLKRANGKTEGKNDKKGKKVREGGRGTARKRRGHLSRPFDATIDTRFISRKLGQRRGIGAVK